MGDGRQVAYISVDVETGGEQAPGLTGHGGMTQLGAVVVEYPLERWFYLDLRGLGPAPRPQSLAEEIDLDILAEYFTDYGFGAPNVDLQIRGFDLWLNRITRYGKLRPVFLSDNNGFDYQFVNYYLWRYVGNNPFGHTSVNIGSLYKGAARTMFKNFKHLRRTPHTHHPVDDAVGNAEAVLRFARDFNIAGLPQLPEGVSETPISLIPVMGQPGTRREGA